MADIEERAKRAWLDWHQDPMNHHAGPCDDARRMFIEAYLIGAAQTQRDYVSHFYG